MADPYGDLSDLDFDEDGIYRDRRETDTLSGLDEDGILLDDEPYAGAYSLHRSDSGFGTAERKHPNRHRHNLDLGSNGNLLVAGGFDGYREDSYPVEERSLNISDFEASDSRSCVSTPLDHRSLDSSIDLDYDDDPSVRRPRRRHRFTSGDDYIPTDRARSGTRGASSHDTTGKREEFNYSRLQEKSEDLRNSTNSAVVEHSHDRSRDSEYSHDTDPRRETTSGNHNNSIDYLLQNRKSDHDQDLDRDSLDGSVDENSVFQRIKGYSKAADSIFTQDDVHVEPTGQSLIEFEELEAALVLPDGGDLIGAYLQDVTERDGKDNDDDENSQEEYGTVRQSSDSLFNDDDESIHDKKENQQSNKCESSEEVRGNTDLSPFGEESLSLIENQQPPFVSSQMSFDTSEGGSVDNTLKGSRIPFLRSRSPSVSRPGSAGPRSRSSSKEGSRSRSRAKQNNRTLPKTPTGSRSRSRSSSIPRLNSQIRRKSSNQTASSEEDRSVDRTIESQADDAEVASLTSNGDGNKKFNKNNRPRPASAGSNVKPPVLRSKSEATINLNRPSSAKQAKSISSSRSNTPKSFRVRSQSTTALVPAKQPLKASHSMAGNILQEGEDGEHQKKLNEETLTQLQQDYTKLLQKYAEAENTIDSLRIGAKIPISLEVSSNGGLGPGQPSPGGASMAQAIRRTSIVSTGGGLLPAQVSRPPSRLSMASVFGDSVAPELPGSSGGRVLTPLVGTDPNQVTEEERLNSTLASEGKKLSILAKAKSIEDQTEALRILLDENHLSVEDQQKALTNIKNGYETLQIDYREAKDTHEILRRQGKLDPTAEQFFDDDKAVEGDLYKLGMKLDDLEHKIQNNVKVKTQPRKPFQGVPMKADHSIGVGGGSIVGTGLSPNRPPSAGSYAGGPTGIDSKVHQLDKKYSELMDQYRRLKQMRKTPERDVEVERCLKELKGIYQQTPEHRRPPLPPELEQKYSSRNEYFVSPMHTDSTKSLNQRKVEAQNKPTRRNLNIDDDRPSANDSDLTIPRELKMLNKQNRNKREDRLGYTSSATASSSSDVNKSYRRKPLSRDKGSFSSFDSLTSDSSNRRMYKLPPRRDREDKDSGYVGSEASRKTNQVPSLRLSALSGRTRTSSRSGAGNADDSDVTTESDDRSTVEYVKPHRPSNNTRRKTSGEYSGSTRPTMHGKPSRHPVSHGEHSGSEEASYVSNATGRTSFRSEQIQNLQKEVSNLKKELQSKTPGISFATNTVPNRDPGHQPQQQYGGYYYYPYSEAQKQQQKQQQPATAYHNQGTGEHVAAAPIINPSVQIQPNAYYDPQYNSVAPQPNVVQPSPYTAPKTAYVPLDHGLHAAPQEYYYGDGAGEQYREPYHRDINDNYPRHHDDDIDSVDHSSPCRRSELRSYYIPNKYRTSSPSRRRSRRDDFEHDTYTDGYDRPGYSSPDRGAYTSPDRHTSPNRRSSRSGRRRGNGYPSPVRAFPTSQGDAQYPSNRYPAPLPPPPAYGSQQHYVASQPPVQGHPQYYPPYASHPQTDSVGNLATHPTANSVMLQHTPAHPYTTVQVPPTMQRSLSLPTGTLPISHDSNIGSQTLIPVQIVPINSTSSSPAPTALLNSSTNSSKVRYYVREYGAESDAEEYTRSRPWRRSQSLPRNGQRSGSRTRAENYYSEMECEGEIGDDLDSSITSALKTAAQLKKMSNKMKASLRDELSRSYRDSSILASYLD